MLHRNSLNAFQEVSFISALGTSCPAESANQGDLRRANRSFGVHPGQSLLLPGIRLQDLERAPKCFNIFGKSRLLLVCSYCEKYRFTHSGSCNSVIDERFLPDGFSSNVQNDSFWYSVLFRLQNRAYSCFAIWQFRIIDPSFFIISLCCQYT